jgi:hypothetical protein
MSSCYFGDRHLETLGGNLHLKEMFHRSEMPLPYPSTSVLRGNQREESRCSNVLSLPFSPTPLESGMFETV